MIFPVWVTFGQGSATSAPVAGAQWAYRTDGHRHRVYPPRARGDVLILPGDLKDPNPALDTWEGEAT